MTMPCMYRAIRHLLHITVFYIACFLSLSSTQAQSSIIPAIPLESIKNSLTRNRIISPALYDAAPYLVRNLGDNLLIGTGDEVYARGAWPADRTSFAVYRPAREYFDDDGGDLLGIEVEYLGIVSIVDAPADDVRRLLVNSSSKEIRIGDRLLVQEQSRIGGTIFPTEPEKGLEGRVIALLNGETMASQLDTVVVNLGERHDLRTGDLLTVREEGYDVVDQVERERMSFGQRMSAILSGQRLSLPGKDTGSLLVYKVFDQVSYALILSSLQPIKLDNRVTNP